MACSIIRQLLEALAFMHSRSVTHRDIKMANVLLRNDGCVKLCDFGMATSLAPAVQPGGGPGGLQPSDSTAEAQLTSYVVTRWYRSPEVLLEQPYNEGVDVWSVCS
ncbi:protein kinase domain-containing protein [Haematococcus lacustris]|uniref:Protein kinase domain-containing protein n=1 Tax=Haematococcus lacustris TaxID=44745 RepID=A0A699YME1_HAELA|nr:protein kinase domain-containing protein [Haematococcus lacustris]